MSPFQPLGDQARWRLVYGLLRETPVNAIVGYDELAEALGLDSESDRHAVQMAVRRAAQELEREDRRALDVVPNKGYRVVEPQEHLTLARRHHKKAGRSLARGHSKAANVDLTGVNPEIRKALELTAQAFALQMDFNKRFAVRQSELEETLGDMTERTTRTEDEIAGLKARLARLEEGSK